MIFTLYQYTNRLNDKRYIGVTCSPQKRFRQHAKGSSGARLFNKAVRKYGVESFNLTILALFDDVAAAAYHEQTAIKAFNTLAPEGYNLTSGAPFTIFGGPLSSTRRMAITETNRKTWADTGIRKNRIEGLRKIGATKDFREHCRKSKIGNKSKLGQKYSEITRARIAKAEKLYWTKAKETNGDSRIGKKHSPETITKMSEARKRYWAARKKE
jgi:group I intron endonuclease